MTLSSQRLADISKLFHSFLMLFPGSSHLLLFVWRVFCLQCPLQEVKCSKDVFRSGDWLWPFTFSHGSSLLLCWKCDLRHCLVAWWSSFLLIRSDAFLYKCFCSFLSSFCCCGYKWHHQYLVVSLFPQQPCKAVPWHRLPPCSTHELVCCELCLWRLFVILLTVVLGVSLHLLHCLCLFLTWTVPHLTVSKPVVSFCFRAVQSVVCQQGLVQWLWLSFSRLISACFSPIYISLVFTLVYLFNTKCSPDEWNPIRAINSSNNQCNWAHPGNTTLNTCQSHVQRFWQHEI